MLSGECGRMGSCVERRACDVESNSLKSRRLFEVNVIMNRKKER